MEKFKLQLDAFVCGYMPKILVFSSSFITLKFSIHNDFKTRVLLKIFHAKFPYKLLFWATLPTRQDGSKNREYAYMYLVNELILTMINSSPFLYF